MNHNPHNHIVGHTFKVVSEQGMYATYALAWNDSVPRHPGWKERGRFNTIAGASTFVNSLMQGDDTCLWNL